MIGLMCEALTSKIYRNDHERDLLVPVFKSFGLWLVLSVPIFRAKRLYDLDNEVRLAGVKSRKVLVINPSSLSQIPFTNGTKY
jgi:hypothetical protein